MNASFRALIFRVVIGLSVAGTLPLAHGDSVPNCGRIAADVSAAVAKDPSKVLMIVEDALVISESCACEIVRAAISSSGADASTIQQIVQTGIAVAPKYSAMIAECASSTAPVAAAEVQTSDDSGKNPAGKNPAGDNLLTGSDGGKSPNPIMPEVDVEDSGGPSLSNFSGNVRGVYLVYPAAAVITTSQGSGGDEDESGNNEECCNGGEQKTVKRANSRRTSHLIPLSPSEADAT